jgi:hypothetical protein
MKTHRTIIATLILLLLSMGVSQATDIVTLPAFVTTASSVTGELKLHPNVGAAAFADNGTFLDTPRSVSTIDNSIVEKFSIKNITQLSSYVSNVQNIGSFGQSSMVYIRGDLSEQYVNSQRRTNNSFGFQPSLNGVEALDLVHGAPSVVFGPGFYSGGYTNYQLKQAAPGNFTNVNVLLGTLTTNGNSFLNATWQYDTNMVLNKDTFLRVSYEGKENGTLFYRNGGRDDTQDLFIALKKVVSKDTILDVYFEYSWQATPELIGVNRVTQDLIWNRRYISGTTTNVLDHSEMPSGPVVKLKDTDTLSSTGDFSNANVYFLQGVVTSRLSPTTTLKNYTLAEYVNRRRFNDYEYIEYVTQTTLDNRTEVHVDNTRSYTIFGLNERVEYRNAQSGYFNTYFNALDATKGRTHSAKSYVNDYFPGSKGTSGRNEFFGPQDGSYDTSFSRTFSVSPFVQQRLHFGRWQFLYGLRADGYRSFVEDPLDRSLRDNITTYSVGNTESLIYSINKHWTAFATIGRLRAVNGTVTGGAVVFDPNLQVSEESFQSLNKLYEVGTRWQRSDKSSVALTGFWQYRQQHNFYANSPDNIMVRGVELEAKTEPNKRTFVIFNLTYMEANFDNSFPFEWNGIGLSAVTEPGNYRIPGLSRVYANTTAGYKLNRNWEVNGTVRAQSEQAGNASGGYHIPSQYSADVQLAYFTKTWRTALTVRNITNERNWVHNGDAYGDNVIISRELPINASVSVSKRF